MATNNWTIFCQPNNSSTLIVLYWLHINPIVPTVLYFFIGLKCTHSFNELVIIVCSSGRLIATGVLLSFTPPVPNPILESTMPILALPRKVPTPILLKPSYLQLHCKEAAEPVRVFHLFRPMNVLRCCLSALRE